MWVLVLQCMCTVGHALLACRTAVLILSCLLNQLFVVGAENIAAASARWQAWFLMIKEHGVYARPKCSGYIV